MKHLSTRRLRRRYIATVKYAWQCRDAGFLASAADELRKAVAIWNELARREQ